MTVGAEPVGSTVTIAFLTPWGSNCSCPGSTFAVGLELPVTDARTFDYAPRARFLVEF